MELIEELGSCKNVALLTVKMTFKDDRITQYLFTVEVSSKLELCTEEAMWSINKMSPWRDSIQFFLYEYYETFKNIVITKSLQIDFLSK